MKLSQPRALWSVPASWGGGALDGVPHLGAHARRANDVPGALMTAFLFSLICLFLLDRFGLRLSDAYSISPALLALYGLAAVMVLTRSAQFSGYGALMYAGIAVACGLSFIVNFTFDPRQYASFSSLLLLLAIYAPFVLTLKPAVGTTALWTWLMKWYVASAVFIGVAGIVQFYAQFVFHAPWLFDFTPFIPAAIRGSGVYNTTNPVGTLVKSNGFFLREASGLSFYMAFALLCELHLKKRKLPMAILALGVIVSYSGSGLLTLAVGLLFPLGRRTVVRVAAATCVCAVVVLVFGDALNLSYTLDRVTEVGSDKSSAYCRFVAPGKLVAQEFDSAVWTPLLGHGSGTTQRLSDVCETTYGKVLFEYGLVGAIAFSALILSAIARSSAPTRLRAALAVQWLLLGGNLLAPESLLLIFLVCGMWPAGKAEPDMASDDANRKPPGRSLWALPPAVPADRNAEASTLPMPWTGARRP